MYAIASSFLDTSLKLSAPGGGGNRRRSLHHSGEAQTLFVMPHAVPSLYGLGGVAPPAGQAIAVLHARSLCLRWACCLSLRSVTGQCVEIGGNPCQDASYACLIELDILGSLLGSGTQVDDHLLTPFQPFQPAAERIWGL